MLCVRFLKMFYVLSFIIVIILVLPQRCLTTMDLTSLGVGSCVGTGMYLVAGMVARKFAGPGVVISFIIAAVASIFSGKYYLFNITLLLDICIVLK